MSRTSVRTRGFVMSSLVWMVVLSGCKAKDEPFTDSGSATTTTTTSSSTTENGCNIEQLGNTVGLRLCTPEAQPGYTLFAPSTSGTTYLINLEGEVVHTWISVFHPGESAYLEENGHLLRTAKDNAGTPFSGGGAGGRVQEFDWDGDLVWEFEYASPLHLQHHDVERLPSGNVLMIAWEYKSEAEAVAWGRAPAAVDGNGLWSDHLIEVDPNTDEIVWEWHVWDHVVQAFDASKPNFGIVADHPELINLNLRSTGQVGGIPDWNHMNGVDYNAALDQIVVSVHNQDEVWIIDHSTSTAEAQGHTGGDQGGGGDLVFRWGSPSNYGVEVDKQLSGQHDPEWIAEGLPGAGNLLVFNNGVTWGESSILELKLPVQADGSYAFSGASYGPSAPMWMYTDPTGMFYSSFVSGSQRLENGNTLICEGSTGRFFEVTDAGVKVWEYINPVGAQGPIAQGGQAVQNRVFRADRYVEDFPAFQGVDLTPLGVIER
ncbi:MAG: arylsulfotransferase (ASST) [Rhodobacterales bacterium]|nr:arylsulfotransferase (ASST) [Rhodobacterales bacterium]